MNEVIEKEEIKIEDMIYEIRGVQVMLDSDLAKLYGTETKRINEAVRRNKEKFPEKYCWILNANESKNFLVANCDQKIETRGGRYKNPRVFTEHAVAMLATILKTPQAIQMSLLIIDAFVAMRHYLIENKDIYKSLNNINNRLTNQENKMLEHDGKLEYIFSRFDKKEQLYLEGQVYDAYSDIIEILKYANKEIIVIDSYADKIFLDLIRNIKCNIILITKDNNKLSDIEIDKYNKQYNNLKVIRNNSYHDRYIIIDKKEIYHSGTSINNIGTKTFSINKLEDKIIKETLLNNVVKIIN